MINKREKIRSSNLLFFIIIVPLFTILSALEFSIILNIGNNKVFAKCNFEVTMILYIVIIAIRMFFSYEIVKLQEKLFLIQVSIGKATYQYVNHLESEVGKYQNSKNIINQDIKNSIPYSNMGSSDLIESNFKLKKLILNATVSVFISLLIYCFTMMIIFCIGTKVLNFEKKREIFIFISAFLIILINIIIYVVIYNQFKYSIEKTNKV